MTTLASWATAHLPDLTGRVAVVTGANSGIGYEAARGLALRGAHVVLACRNEDKVAAALDALRAAVPDARAEVRRLDLASLDSVRAFADGYGLDRLDVLVNNAGVMAIPRRETADGFEMQFGTNVLGHYALTGRLLPRLLATPRSRTVWLSSVAHRFGRIHLDNLNAERSYSPWGAYGQSKLADLMLAFELDRRLHAARSDSASVAAHPGYTSTNLQGVAADMKGSKVEAAVQAAINRAVAMPTWKGALPTLLAAAGTGVRGGDYVGPTGWGEVWGTPGKARPSRHALDARVAGQLADACERLTGVALDPGAAGGQ